MLCSGALFFFPSVHVDDEFKLERDFASHTVLQL